MPIQPVKPKNGVVATAPAIIAQQELAAAYRDIQHRYEARILDLENELASRRGKMRKDYLDEMEAVRGGNDDE